MCLYKNSINSLISDTRGDPIFLKPKTVHLITLWLRRGTGIGEKYLTCYTILKKKQSNLLIFDGCLTVHLPHEII